MTHNNKSPDKIYINQAIKQLSISRATVYKYLRQLDIKPQKSEKKSYLTPAQIQQIREKIHSSEPSKTAQTAQTPQTVATPTVTDTAITVLSDQLNQEKKKNEQLQEKVEQLTREAGQWEGIARTLEQKNQDLLQLAQSQIDTPKASSTGFWAWCKKHLR